MREGHVSPETQREMHDGRKFYQTSAVHRRGAGTHRMGLPAPGSARVLSGMGSNDAMRTTDQKLEGPDRKRVLLGLAFILLGLSLMSYRLDVWEIHLSRHYWPVILVVLGLVKLIDPPLDKHQRRSRRSGMWLIYLGAWGLISEFELFGFGYRTSWPLLIIGVGLNTVWRAFEASYPREKQES